MNSSLLLLTASSATPLYLRLRHPDIDCLSWRLAVEMNDNQNFESIPDECQEYIGHYMLDYQYGADCKHVAKLAYEYAKSVQIVGDGKDVWVFDVDDSTLSNVLFQYDVGSYRTKTFNSTAFVEWELLGVAPAVPGMVNLYNKLHRLGFKFVFITGKSATTLTDITIYNMKKVGYHTWEKLMFRYNSEKELTKLEYKTKKRREIIEEGYRIWGNMGDQWSDLLGENPGNRTFKLPMPMFYSA